MKMDLAKKTEGIEGFAKLRTFIQTLKHIFPDVLKVEKNEK
jgi:hypothetical protein